MAGTGPGWPPTAPTATEEAAKSQLSTDLQALLRELVTGETSPEDHRMLQTQKSVARLRHGSFVQASVLGEATADSAGARARVAPCDAANL